MVYTQGGWNVLKVGEMGGKRKELVVLRLSHLGVFKLVVHRDFPLKVKRVV
jgi:putative transposase